MRTASNLFFGLLTATIVRGSPQSGSCAPTLASQPAQSAGPQASSGPGSSLDSNVTSNAQLVRDLLSAPTARERARMLLVDGDSLRSDEELNRLLVFDFNGAEPANGSLGGAARSADLTTYPFSAGLDISMTTLFLEPCGINTPHTHLRAAEFLILVEGSNLRFGSVLEDGLLSSTDNQELSGTLEKLQATAFPQGSLHWQFNDACEGAVVIAALNSGDPGTSRMAQNFLSLDPSVLNATLGSPPDVGGRTIEDIKQGIPANLAQDVSSCLARCGQ